MLSVWPATLPIQYLAYTCYLLRTDPGDEEGEYQGVVRVWRTDPNPKPNQCVATGVPTQATSRERIRAARQTSHSAQCSPPVAASRMITCG